MIEIIKQRLNGSEYDFLRTNEHIKDTIMFLTLGGSYAYGTNIEGSDIDIRGCALNSKADLIGLSSIEQVIDTKTDTTIYSFNKFISLIINCNPNTIEMLGCKPEHYLEITPIGQELLDNKHLFLSKRAVHSFGGYANQQLRRLENALARDTYPQAEKERHILNSVKCSMMTFESRFKEFEEGSINLYIDDSDQDDIDKEIFVDVNLRHYPLRDYKGMWSDMNTVVKEYAKLNGRNRKKDDAHLNKHAMHLIRLYLMCIDILEKGEINTFRDKEHDLLMDIRNGKYQKEDGTFHREFFDMVDDYEKRVNYAIEHTNLPEKPDEKKIEEFVISVNERVVTGDY